MCGTQLRQSVSHPRSTHTHTQSEPISSCRELARARAKRGVRELHSRGQRKLKKSESLCSNHMPTQLEWQKRGYPFIQKYFLDLIFIFSIYLVIFGCPSCEIILKCIYCSLSVAVTRVFCRDLSSRFWVFYFRAFFLSHTDGTLPPELHSGFSDTRRVKSLV